MSMINEQVMKLRKLAKDYSDWGIGIKRTDRVLREAADTIEALSAKLAAANMERSKLVEDIILTVERETENSNHTEYKCDDDSVIHTDVGYVEDWFNEYKHILREKYCKPQRS